MAEVVLIHPEVGDMDALRTSPSLPLNLLHASTLTAQEFDVAIVDRRLEREWKKRLDEVIGKETLLVGFTAFTGGMIASNLEMAKYVRNITEAPMVWGGVHATIEPEITLMHPLVDIVAIGEGEETLLELARALKQKAPLEGIKGLWYKENGELRKNPDRDLLDLNTLPDIPYHLVDVKKYMPLYMGKKSLFFQSSRGCPHVCTYCYNLKFNKRKFRYQDAGHVLKRIRYAVEKFGAEDIYFVDDNFFVDIRRDQQLIEGIKELGISWQIQGVDIMALKRMDDNFLRLLQKSGLKRLTIGIESGSPRIRKLMKKAGSVEDIKAVMQRLKNIEIIVFVSFLVGFPTETLDEIKETVNLLLDLLKINPKINNSPIYIYKAYPGTPMFELAIKEGLKPPTNLEDWAKLEWKNFGYFGNGKGSDNRISKTLEALYFVSNFLDHKVHVYDLPRIVRFFADLYRPIARWRVKNLNFDLLVEKRVAEFAQWLLEKKNSLSAYTPN